MYYFHISVPRVNDIVMEVEVVFMVNGNPRITIQFQVSTVICMIGYYIHHVYAAGSGSVFIPAPC